MIRVRHPEARARRWELQEPSRRARAPQDDGERAVAAAKSTLTPIRIVNSGRSPHCKTRSTSEKRQFLMLASCLLLHPRVSFPDEVKAVTELALRCDQLDRDGI